MVQPDGMGIMKGVHSLDRQVERNRSFWLELLLELLNLQNLYFFKYCDIKLYYIYIVCTEDGAQL
jgi:hypothetical protein